MLTGCTNITRRAMWAKGIMSKMHFSATMRTNIFKRSLHIKQNLNDDNQSQNLLKLVCSGCVSAFILFSSTDSIVGRTDGDTGAGVIPVSAKFINDKMLASYENDNVVRTNYLIIGATLAAKIALRHIRSLHPNAHCIVLVENAQSLSGLPLTEFEGAHFVVGQRISRLDVESNVVLLDPGRCNIADKLQKLKGNMNDSESVDRKPFIRAIEFNACLLAQGGERLPPAGSHNFETFSKTNKRCSSFVVDCSRRPGSACNARHLIEQVRMGAIDHVTITGSGWKSVKLACDLRTASKEATIILTCSESAPLGHFLPTFIRNKIRKKLLKMGIQIKGYQLLAYVRGKNDENVGHSTFNMHPYSMNVLDAPSPMPVAYSEKHAAFGKDKSANNKKTAGKARTFSAGELVELCGLVNYPQFNGLKGRVIECDTNAGTVAITIIHTDGIHDENGVDPCRGPEVDNSDQPYEVYPENLRSIALHDELEQESDHRVQYKANVSSANNNSTKDRHTRTKSAQRNIKTDTVQDSHKHKAALVCTLLC